MGKYFEMLYTKAAEIVTIATESLKDDSVDVKEKLLIDEAVDSIFEMFASSEIKDDLYDAISNYEIRRDLKLNDPDGVVSDVAEWFYSYLPDMENNPSKELLKKADDLDNFFRSFCILNKIDLSYYEDREDTFVAFREALKAAKEKAVEG